MNVVIDGARLWTELDELAQRSETAPPAITRIVYSLADLASRAYFKGLCVDAGLELREDAVGNTFARWVGSEPSLPAVGTGSHIDAIPHSGRFDGTVGVFGGLEAIRALQRSGYQPRRSIELLMFTSEEPTRFGIGCLGSRLLTGSLSPAAAAALTDREGKTLVDLARFDGSLESVPLTKDYYSAFVELHIEQGPLLEARQVPIGVVTAIAAPASLRIFIEGKGGHAGAVLMPDRHDAFMAAAEIALAVERAAKATGVVDTVGTTGVCEVFPGLINSIPSRVRLEIDVRDIDVTRRDAVLKSIEDACAAVATERGVSVRKEMINADAPSTSDPVIVEAAIQSAKSLDLIAQKMVSRAYHDTLFMSRIAPTAMIFIPCRKGISHTPEEYASQEDIVRGTAVLAHTLARLAA